MGISPLDDALIPSDPNALHPGLKLLHTFVGHKREVSAMEWSPDGRWVASGSQDWGTRVWDATTGQVKYIFESFRGHAGEVIDVAWAPDGRWLASSAEDRTVRIWGAWGSKKGKELHRLQGHPDIVLQVKWSPDGERLASCSRDGTICIWDPLSGKQLHKLNPNSPFVYGMVWSPDGKCLAWSSFDGTIWLWENGDFWVQPARSEFHAPEDAVSTTYLAWSPQGKWLASSAHDGGIWIWDPVTRKDLHKLEGHTQSIGEIKWSPDGTMLAAGSYDGTMRIWNPMTGKELQRLEGHTSGVVEIAWSPDGTMLASGSGKYSSGYHADDTEVRIWCTNTWEPFPAITGLKGDRELFAWHPTLPQIVTSGRRSEDLFLWEVDLKQLTSKGSSDAVYYKNAKVVLAGESGVGKTGLGLVLTNHPFAPTKSTHGRHVWRLDEQKVMRANGQFETREIWLWDLAGQENYRLIHQLHLYETTLALIVFDATIKTDIVTDIRYWHLALSRAKHEDSAINDLKIILVSARTDAGRSNISPASIEELRQELHCIGYQETSAMYGGGITELAQTIRTSIGWDDITPVTSTKQLESIKEFVKDQKHIGRVLCEEDELYQDFQELLPISNAQNVPLVEFKTALYRLDTLGEVRRLSFGNLILLHPERLDAYISELLLIVAKESDGLGSIEEERIKSGGIFRNKYSKFKEFHSPNAQQEQWLCMAMIQELVRHELFLKEDNLFVFPSQTMREHPEYAQILEKQIVIFTFEDPGRLIYTRLVVRLARSSFFVKEQVWQHIATYTDSMRKGGTYGLLLSPREGGLFELGLFFNDSVSEEMCLHFENFVRDHLKNHTKERVQRRRQFICPTCGNIFTEIQVSRRRKLGHNSIPCSICNTDVSLLDREERLVMPYSSRNDEMKKSANEKLNQAIVASQLEGKEATKDFDVFLCHNSKDKQEVKEIGDRLRASAILPWLDERELRPGDHWSRELEKQILRIKAAAVFVGKNGISAWQRRELAALLHESDHRGCRIIPVLLADAPEEPLPIFLNPMTWVDFRKQKPDPMEQLLWGIRGER